MKRFICFLTLTVGILIIAGQAFVSAQDKVERRDKKGGSSFVTGKIVEENASGVKIKPTGLGKEEVIPSSEIVRMTYADLPAKASLDIGKMAPAEAAHDYPALLKGYEVIQALPEVKTSGPNARRYIDYRVITLRAAIAEGD